MILLSISPFIFIQCGSGGAVGWGRVQKGVWGRRGARRARAGVGGKKTPP